MTALAMNIYVPHYHSNVLWTTNQMNTVPFKTYDIPWIVHISFVQHMRNKNSNFMYAYLFLRQIFITPVFGQTAFWCQNIKYK
jgi:hypothetical protein